MNHLLGIDFSLCKSLLRVQEKQGALRRYYLLSQPLLPPPSPLFQWTPIVLRMSHIRLVPCPPPGQWPLTGRTRQNGTLISFAQLTAAEWLGRQVRTLSENTHRRDNGELLVGPPLAVRDTFPFSWSRMTHLSIQREKIREAEVKVKLFFFFFAFDSTCMKTGYIGTSSSWVFDSLLLAEPTDCFTACFATWLLAESKATLKIRTYLTKGYVMSWKWHCLHVYMEGLWERFSCLKWSGQDTCTNWMNKKQKQPPK